MKFSILQQEKFHCCSRGDGDLPLLGYGIFQWYYTTHKKKTSAFAQIKGKVTNIGFFHKSSHDYTTSCTIGTVPFKHPSTHSDYWLNSINMI